jgi:hypothetical protein
LLRLLNFTKGMGMGRSCVSLSCHLPFTVLALPSAFYGSEKTIPNMLFVFLAANFYSMGSRVLLAGSLGLAFAKRRDGGNNKRRRKQKLPLFEYLSGVERALSNCSRPFWDFDGGRKLFFFFFFLSLLRCAMNKDIPADLNCVFCAFFFQLFWLSLGQLLDILYVLSSLIIACPCDRANL